jgi:hypothetical protein
VPDLLGAKRSAACQIVMQAAIKCTGHVDTFEGTLVAAKA